MVVQQFVWIGRSQLVNAHTRHYDAIPALRFLRFDDCLYDASAAEMFPVISNFLQSRREAPWWLMLKFSGSRHLVSPRILCLNSSAVWGIKNQMLMFSARCKEE